MKHHLNPKTIIIAAFVVLLSIAVYPNLTKKTVDIVFGEQPFVLEVADTPAKQQRGLSGREGLEPNTGMLFVFDTPGRYSFWMKDMRFPIDIMWLRDDWCVVHTIADLSPETYPDTFAPPVPATYVIELASGALAEHKVRNGACFDPLEL